MTKVKISLHREDHIQGPSDAPFTLVEYGDYECPACVSAHGTIKRLRKKFPAHFRFVFRNFPQSGLHPHAMMAAQAAEFAELGNRFWEMHDLILENPKNLNLASLLRMGESLGLPLEDLELAIVTHAFSAKIENDIQEGRKMGVLKSPTFFMNGEQLSYTELESALQKKGVVHDNPQS
jgi:protein-disulfide isomerase